MTGLSIHLHEDLLLEILLRLPVKSLTRFKCVSKAWSDLISSLEFVERHLNQSAKQDSGCGLVLWDSFFLRSFDFRNPEHLTAEVDHPDCIKSLVKHDVILHFDVDHPTHHCPYPPEIVGSCNGLLCITRMNSELILYNPATTDCKQVPRPNFNHVLRSNRYKHHDGFGYDRVGNDYKILTLSTCSQTRYYQPRNMVEETHLYSLEANKWQVIENPSLDHGIMLGHRCVTANNSLYWPASNGTTCMILRFDLSTHIFEVIPFPEKSKSLRRLAALKGLVHLMTDNAHIWVLENDSWTKLFHCSSAKCKKLDPSFHLSSRTKPCRVKSEWPLPFAYSKYGRKILIGIDQKPKRFICFDLESQSTSEVEFSGFPEDATLTAEPWFESLVPL